MNNSEERAKALAHAAELVERANEHGSNFAPIAELICLNDSANEIAKDLLEVYFQLTYFVCNCKDDPSFIGGPLYTLRSVYEAFAEMQHPAESTVILQVKDTPKTN